MDGWMDAIIHDMRGREESLRGDAIMLQ